MVRFDRFRTFEAMESEKLTSESRGIVFPSRSQIELRTDRTPPGRTDGSRRERKRTSGRRRESSRSKPLASDSSIMENDLDLALFNEYSFCLIDP